MPRTQSRTLSMFSALDRVRIAAKRNKDERFSALLHHVTLDRLYNAFLALSRDAAPGVDGVTWEHYEANLQRNLEDLHSRVHRGAYRAKPSRRAYIPKPDGRQRPLGIAAQEDKIPQRAVAEVLNAIYGAPGKVWRFQRVKIPPRQGVSHPTGNRALGLWR